MRILLLLFLLPFAGITGIFAQNTTQSSIFFELDKFDLNAEAAQTLQTLAASLATAPDYEIKINAFTDNTGSVAYNEQLALNRGQSVQQALAAQGIITEKTVVRGWGEQKQQFSNQTETGRSKNRRVDLEITVWTIDNPETFRKRINNNREQSYPITNLSLGQTITTPSGVIVVVPPNAFVEEDGSAPKDPVQLVLKEALKPGDWLAMNLGTVSNGELLESGGMLSVEAVAAGRPLRLADDAELTVAIPAAQKVDPDMRLFYGQHTESDSSAATTPVTNWTLSADEDKFRQVLERDEYSRILDKETAAKLRALKVEIPPKPNYASLALVPVNKPKAPVAPTKLRTKAVPPDRVAINKTFSKKGKMTARQERLAAQEYKRMYEIYLQDSVVCDRNLQNYNARQNVYLAEKAIYDQKYKQWQGDLLTNIRTISEYQDAAYAHFYGGGLSNVLKKAGTGKKLQYTSLQKTFARRAERVANQICSKDRDYTQANSRLNLYKVDVDVLRWGKRDCEPRIIACITNDSCRRDLMGMIEAQCGLKNISDSILAVDAEKRMAMTGSATQKNALMASYVTEITRLGWVNVDKFSKDPSPRIALEYELPEAFAMYAYLPKLNSMMMMTKDESGTFYLSGIPTGQPVELVTLKTEGGKIWMNRQKVVAGQKKVPEFAFKPYSMLDIKKELASL